MPDLIPFHFGTHSVNVHLDEDANPWWTLQEICDVLSLSNPSRVASRLRPHERTTLTFSESGIPHQLLLVNESGLYRIIMRSNKPEAEQFQDWVCQEVLPQIRKTGRYEAPQQPLPPTYQEQIGKMQAYVALAESLGMLEDRDRLMVKDMARTLLPLHLGLSPVAAHPKALTEAGGFFLSDRVRALGYCPTRKQEATLMSKGLAREVSKEYRDRHGEKPPQSSRFVDGAVRPVFWYAEGNAGWIDPLIQTWCARVGIES